MTKIGWQLNQNYKNHHSTKYLQIKILVNSKKMRYLFAINVAGLKFGDPPSYLLYESCKLFKMKHLV